jgi:hypothetical protein
VVTISLKSIVALLILAVLAACQVTASQSMGGGLTIRRDVMLDGDDTTNERTTDDQQPKATEDRKPDPIIGGGIGGGVRR